ncbi:MAG TPA: hypothetical protein VKX41_18930 [Alloacidobacterium sp.]|nr:hypothetical protein [Alloacidobacterium sp.]
MSTYTHPLQPMRSRRFEIVQRNRMAEIAEVEASTNAHAIPADDGLGCMRGLMAATLFNILLVLAIAAGWELWRLLR